MPSCAGACGAGQVAIEMRVDRAGDMRFAVGRFARRGIDQAEAAVDDRQIAALERDRQRLCLYRSPLLRSCREILLRKSCRAIRAASASR
jgi:hypothetical protein